MPYIGAKQLKASDLKRFSVTGSTSATHALSWTAPNEQSLIITINGVKQHDGSYTISGSPTTITLSSALVSSDEMEVIGINDIGTTITPAQNSVDTDKIANNAVTTAKFADNQITSAKLANAINITSGNSLTIDSGATITNNGTNGGGFGKVLQVVQGTYATQVSTTGSTPVTSNLSASITPSSTSSKIFLSATVNSFYTTGAAANAFLYIYRDGSNILVDSKPAAQEHTNGGTISTTVGLTLLDSPSSTSSLTYEIYFANVSSSTSYVHSSGYPSFIVLMEIAG